MNLSKMPGLINLEDVISQPIQCIFVVIPDGKSSSEEYIHVSNEYIREFLALLSKDLVGYQLLPSIDTMFYTSGISST